MTTHSDDMTDLDYTLDVKNVINDVRLIIKHYAWDYDWTNPNAPVYTPIDLIKQYGDADSIAKYGRRTFMIKRYVRTETYADWLAFRNADDKGEPYGTVKFKLVGSDATKIVACLNTKISDSVTVAETNSGLSDDYWVDQIVLKVNEDRVPRCTVSLTAKRPSEEVTYFIIDTDSIDGEKYIL